ncbi:MAG TPA: class I SAM-dependent methyltransferase, partial [Pararhizobium sp.]|nr:class I SAM-dependent methyltransferase [Pararhizobium sp.]
MASVAETIAAHYESGSREDRILTALSESGVDVSRLTAQDLEPLDELHIGGPKATADLLAKMEIGPQTELLDIGSGIGGPARFAARTTGAHVTGLDLTESHVATATRLSAMTGLSAETRFVQGSAFAMPFADASFDAAMSLYVGMNLPDKPQLMHEAARVLRPGGIFAVYDLMRTAGDALTFPLPWAASEETSFVETPDAYKKAAAAAGFEIAAEHDRRAFALDFIAGARAEAAAAKAEGRKPPLGPVLMMGEDARAKMANMAAALEACLLSPT